MLDYGARQSLFQGTDVVLRRWPSTFLFDFNMVITNLNKVDKAEAMELISTLRQSIQSSAELNKSCAQEFADIPLVGKTIFEQRQMLYDSLLEGLDHFEEQFLQKGAPIRKAFEPSCLKLHFGLVYTKEWSIEDTRYAKSLLGQSLKIMKFRNFCGRTGTD